MRQFFFKFCGTSLSLAFFIYFIFTSSNLITKKNLAPLLNIQHILVMVTASILYALIIPLSAWSWSRLLAATGETWPSIRLAAIMGVTQIAKYVPGNFAQHIGRATLSIAQGMNPRVFALTILIETILAVTSCLLLSFAFWFLSMRIDALATINFGIKQFQQIGILALSLFTCSALLGFFLIKLPHILERMPSLGNWQAQGLKLPNISTAALAMSIYALNYVLIGLGMWLVSLVSSTAAPSFLYLTAVFSIAWLIGFFAPGLPAGLGAREGVMLLMLANVMPHEEALLLTISMRLVTFFGDLICFFSGLWLLQLNSSKRSNYGQ